MAKVTKKANAPKVSKAQVLKQLKAEANPANLAGMARYGMNVEKRLGVPIPFLRRLAKEIGHNHSLALELWKTGIAEARILASMIAEPQELSTSQMDDWVNAFDSWDVCDQVCMNLFDKSPFADKKLQEWSERKEEYVKRAAFTLIACVAWHDKEAPDRQFIEYLGVIKKGATDERNYVRKAVNWALRNIGKRNMRLNKAALKTAREIERLDSKAARWIAADAIRELESDAVKERL